MNILEGREDITCLWDIRIHPDYRHQGMGIRLFDSAACETRKKNCKLIKVETQNVNVNACKLYLKQGYTLGRMNKYACKDFPDEIRLTWYRFIQKCSEAAG